MAQQIDYWDHNVHYQPVILNAVPAGCRTALDVGCGDGMLVRRLATRCGNVTGIDRDAPTIRLARERSDGIANVSFLKADFLAHPLPEASFDFAVRRTARRTLPGARYRRRLLWRYLVVWDKPA
jgi:ubiquinone/menaquinone biosynthesis C-methylase UbiE